VEDIESTQYSGPIPGNRHVLRKGRDSDCHPPPPIRGWRWYAPDPIKEKEKKKNKSQTYFFLSLRSLLAQSVIASSISQARSVGPSDNITDGTAPDNPTVAMA
jgi:hypothetical protein